MILEIADIRIKPESAAQFDAAIRHGVESVIAHAHGFRGYRVTRGIETPERFVLMIFWDTLEDHMVAFRGSAAFPQWRAIVGPHFAAPPAVEHFTLIAGREPAGGAHAG